jgi:hypothetical protein
MVEYDLPKVEVRVRFPLPAQRGYTDYMKKLYLLGGLILLIGIVLFVRTKPAVATAEGLIAQLHGGACRFEVKNDIAVKRHFLSGFNRRNDAEMCVIDAAQLLASAHNNNPIVAPALIEALKNNPNVDSGDGIIEVRSEIAIALGKVGDKRALQPLQDILKSEDPVRLSKAGSFPDNYEIQKGTSHKTIQNVIAEINRK